jgi:ribosomal protein S18 acetylase RimI-like enzyme
MKSIIVRNYKNYSPAEKGERKSQLLTFYNKNLILSQWSAKYFSNFLDDKNERKMLCLILEKDHKILGFILGRMVGNIDCRYNLITLLIDKKYRGKGLSKTLLDRFLKIIRKNSTTKKVYLHFRDSSHLENFYRHYGFRKHRITGHYSNGEKKHYMEIPT